MRTGRPPIPDEVKWIDYLAQLERYVEQKDECLLWTGQIFGNGYGRLYRYRPVVGTHARVHIFSYLLFRGAIPQGLFVCHACDVKRCINPDHLWLGTNRDNQIDASRKGAFARYWTEEQRLNWSHRMRGNGNPMYGRRAGLAPAYGRVGSMHPMFGKHHTVESKEKISTSLLKFHREK